MFNHDQLHDPEFRNLVRAARAVIAGRVGRGIATPAERLAVAALDEMPDEDDPDAVRAWAPSAAFRDAVRSSVLATLALYAGIVECCRSTDEPYIDTDTAIDRFRNRKPIFTPPRELQAAISNALRATGRLDDSRGGRPRARRRHEEEARDHRVELAALQGDLVGRGVAASGRWRGPRPGPPPRTGASGRSRGPAAVRRPAPGRSVPPAVLGIAGEAGPEACPGHRRRRARRLYAGIV